jgi:hypothetical protein
MHILIGSGHNAHVNHFHIQDTRQKKDQLTVIAYQLCNIISFNPNVLRKILRHF